jgi:sugar/nucleoside kinase (ribokinase family)
MTSFVVGEDAAPAPELLVIGHATRDLLPTGGWRLGGTVTFAALTAVRLGVGPVGIVTSGPEDVLAALHATLPGASIAAAPSAEATTYENLYTARGRRQYLRGRAAPLTLDDVPPHWRGAPVVLLAPLAHEVDPALAAAFHGALIGATAQGWLRRFGDDGLVTAGPLDVAERLLPHLSALILSAEDLPAQASARETMTSSDAFASISVEAIQAQVEPWAQLTPHVVVTLGAAGALLLAARQPDTLLPGYPVTEVDPTGAGDVFAMAFLCELWTTGDVRAAVDFANRVAALSVEGPGATNIPSRAEVAARFG